VEEYIAAVCREMRSTLPQGLRVPFLLHVQMPGLQQWTVYELRLTR